MSTISQQISSASRVFDALGAITRWKAALLLAASVLAGGLLLGAAAGLSLYLQGALGAITGLLLGIPGIVVIFYGFFAVGVYLMQEVRTGQVPTVRQAINTALATGHRQILFALMIAGGYLVLALMMLLLLLLCKIPFIGPVLLFVVYPLGVLTFGLVSFALMFIVYPLTAPAFWAGSTITAAVAHLWAIVRKNLAQVLIYEGLLYLALLLVGVCVSVVFVSGVGAMTSLSASLLYSGNPETAISASRVIAFTSGLLGALAVVLPALVTFKGIAITYIDAAADVDASDVAARLNQASDELRQKLDPTSTPAAPAPAASYTAVEPQTPPLPVLPCPVCQAPVSAGDAFCGECGSKLK
ncbi:hypothetical protein IGB42_02559 [Andreprevotia sp. IGB-42]|uniref:hypothetical protein n=1 Tax=Andreprevotia sp. IGB-42 TaxID=2497473 RepID=UPI00135BFAAF|nr:hypothetical protein [Andreprevotia sp. IGB-42]KAF0812719.1 hypothetical protein IGB42_02559 [Andreprevotia sp. IGB-42]